MATWSQDRHTFSATLVGLDPVTNDSSFDSYLIRVQLAKCKWLISRRYSMFRKLYLDLSESSPDEIRTISFPVRIPFIHVAPILMKRRMVELTTFLQLLTEMLQSGKLHVTNCIGQFFAIDQFEREAIMKRLIYQIPFVDMKRGWLCLSRIQICVIAQYDSNKKCPNSDELSKDAALLFKELSNLRSCHVHSRSISQIVSLDETSKQQLDGIPVMFDAAKLTPQLMELELVQIDANSEIFGISLPSTLKKFAWTKSRSSGDFERFMTCMNDLAVIGNDKGQKTSPYGPAEMTFTGNALKRIDGASLLRISNQLRILNLSCNQLVSFDRLSTIETLEVLDISQNSIENFQSTAVFKHLKFLTVAANLILRVGPVNDSFPALTHLDLSSNRIRDIADTTNLVGMVALTHLVLDGNPLASNERYKEQVSDVLQRPIAFNFEDSGNA